MTYRRLAAMVLGLAVATAGRATAGPTLVIGNLPGNNNNLANIGEGLTADVGFTMGSTSYTLADATLELRLGAPSSNAPLLQLRADTSGSPGAVLETFTTPGSLPTGDNPITFTPSTPFTLQANTSYFLYLTSSTTTGAFYNWLGSNPVVNPTGPGATYLAGSASPTGPLSFQVDGTVVAAVPEPSTLVGACIATLAGAGALWRRRAG